MEVTREMELETAKTAFLLEDTIKSLNEDYAKIRQNKPRTPVAPPRVRGG